MTKGKELLLLSIVALELVAVGCFSPSAIPGRAAIPVSVSHHTQYQKFASSTKSRTWHYLSAETTTLPSQEETESEPLFEPLGKGLIRDYRDRLPYFFSDITDGFNVQCLAGVMFLFFACLAPAVGFGGLYGAATGNAIGTVEMVASTALGGVVYALAAGQPLTIIGSTGPVLAFVAALASLAKNLNLPFLPLYAWTGLWTSAILFIAALTSASNLVKYLTRFTDEIFSVLISTIFVVEAVCEVGGTFTWSTLTKALLTLTCATSTYAVATILKKIRTSVYFNKTTRNTISSFGPTIGVIVGSLIARKARLVHGAGIAGLPSLAIPEVFGTTSGRPWLIPIFDLPVWARWAAFIPGIMASVLLFLDQTISVRLVNNPKWKMKKARSNVLDGMHADMFVIAALTAFQSLVGLPWLVAATVRSLSHVSALSKFDNTGKLTGTIEQRVTGTLIHALIGCCIFFGGPRQLLAQVPLPVLMGLFMYLGTSHLPGNEMWERFLEFFKDKSVAPKQPWTDKVPIKVTRMFTVTQIACLIAMFGVKESQYGVFFPVIVAMLAPIRFALERTGVVKKEYMEILDSE